MNKESRTNDSVGATTNLRSATPEPQSPLDATAIAHKVNEFRNAIGVLDTVGEKVTAIYAQSLLDYLSVERS